MQLHDLVTSEYARLACDAFEDELLAGLIETNTFLWQLYALPAILNIQKLYLKTS